MIIMNNSELLFPAAIFMNVTSTYHSTLVAGMPTSLLCYVKQFHSNPFWTYTLSWFHAHTKLQEHALEEQVYRFDIPVLRSNDSGRYMCQVSGRKTLMWHAEYTLTVLGKNNICLYNTLCTPIIYCR